MGGQPVKKILVSARGLSTQEVEVKSLHFENISKLSNVKSIVKSAQEEQEKFGRLSIDTIK